METKVFSIKGKEVKTITLADSVFNLEKISHGSIYEAIKNELANLRVGTASTKTRSEVRGSTAKPWKQKGTGRARAGRKRSPLWKGGSTIFGPKPRDYSYSVPKKLKRLAMRSILSLKAQNDKLVVIENFTIESGKTKDMLAILKNLSLENKKERVVLILKDDNEMLKRASRNLVNVKFLTYNRLRAHDLFYSKKILMLEGAALNLNEFYIN